MKYNVGSSGSLPSKALLLLQYNIYKVLTIPQTFADALPSILVQGIYIHHYTVVQNVTIQYVIIMLFMLILPDNKYLIMPHIVTVDTTKRSRQVEGKDCACFCSISETIQQIMNRWQITKLIICWLSYLHFVTQHLECVLFL